MSLTSEDHVLSAIARHFPGMADYGHLLNERDDDCAVMRVGEPLCVSTDLFIEDVHFRRRYFTPQDIGWKSLAVNLSDLAACGARPIGFSLALALPPDTDEDFVDNLFAGMAELSLLTNTPLTGGDLSKSDKIHLAVTVLGEASTPLRRGQAKPGDALFLIGQLGLARVGFLRLEAENQAALRNAPESCAAHLRPLPLLPEGRMLQRFAQENPNAHLGVMDLSDGLARDIPRLIGLKPSGSTKRADGAPGADIMLPPPHPEIARYCAANELDPDRFMLAGGEDYALIGSCSAEAFPALRQAMPGLVHIGVVTSTSAVLCRGKEIDTGFDHFH